MTVDHRRGFTIPELIIVVGCIGILAVAAIPNFLGMQHQAWSAEGEILIHAVAHRVRIAQEEGQPVASCGPSPAQVPQGPTDFGVEPCWRDLGFLSLTQVRHQLALQVLEDGHFVVTAVSDLDEDGKNRTSTLDSRRPAFQPGALDEW